MGERFTLLVEALADPDDVQATIRLRGLLKVALRRFHLRCVELGPAPDAWYGWRRQPDGQWMRICCAPTEELCRELLAGRAGVCRVLPKGRFPHKEGPK